MQAIYKGTNNLLLIGVLFFVNSSVCQASSYIPIDKDLICKGHERWSLSLTFIIPILVAIATYAALKWLRKRTIIKEELKPRTIMIISIVIGWGIFLLMANTRFAPPC